MAACRWCEQEMTTAASCTFGALHEKGARVEMIPWGKERRWSASSRCGDCGVFPGGYHHPGCDIQECPRRGGQMFSCGCRFDEDRSDPDEDDTEGDGEVINRYVDGNGCLTEHVRIGDQEVIVHYGEVPDKDLTTVDGVPCTTALRTVIDIAPSTRLGRPRSGCA